MLRSDERRCARPDCAAAARATLVFSYGEQQAVLTRLSDERRPQTYDLCPTHASRTSAPYGWHLRDDRPEDERRVRDTPGVPDDLGGDHTVEVLAAALRAVPARGRPGRHADRASEPATGQRRAAAVTAADPDPAVVIDELIDAPEPHDRPEPPRPRGRSDQTSGTPSGPSRRPRPVLAARPRDDASGAPGAPAADW